MGLKETIKHMRDLLAKITIDLEKSDKGNKAASQRVRTGTVKLEKIAKNYRKESIKTEKSTKSSGRAKKAPAAKKAAGKKPAVKKAVKAKPHAKTHKAKPRALSFKRPTAKLLNKRSFR